MSKPLSNRVALVTGASRGIGYATALAMAKAGADVVATARTVEGLHALGDEITALGSRATLFPLDMQNTAGIDQLARLVNERYGRLDVLVGNAGVPGQIAPLTDIDLTTWNEAFAVNVTANLCLIQAFDSLLRRSDAGRVVFVSSGVAATARKNWGTYTVTKAALELVARTYAGETADTPIRVNVYTPGAVRTKLYAAVMPDTDPATLMSPEPPAEKLLDLCLPAFQETGKFYSFPQKRLLSFRPPA